MTTDVNTMSREDLEMEIIDNDSLYYMFDESKFLNREYTLEELREVAIEWIMAGDEVAL